MSDNTISIIENNRFVRDGFALFLQNNPAFRLIGSYASCEQAFVNANFAQSRLVLIDLNLPGTSGLQGIAFVREHYPHMLSLVYSREENASVLLQAIAAGAVGFVHKSSSRDEILNILQLTFQGGSLMSPSLARHILGLQAKAKHFSSPKMIRLTEAEQKILLKITNGKSYQTIASELGIPMQQVLRTLRQVYLKIQSTK